jgi:hypothetical protein
MDNYNDIKIIGTGVWFSIHLLCEKAVRTKDKDDYALANNFIILILNSLPPYSEDVIKYVKTFKAFNTPKELSIWAYGLHNITKPKEPVSHKRLTRYFSDLEYFSVQHQKKHNHEVSDEEENLEECNECSQDSNISVMVNRLSKQRLE